MSIDLSVQENVFNMLVRPVRRLIEEKQFELPTEPQKKIIPLILNGKNVLLISPTASGKTEAAMLPILSKLIQMPRSKPGIKVLYITPLRALNRDMLDRLEWWCNKLDLKLAVRHGDTDTRERTRQSRSPPDILITTPETLQALLFGWVLRRHLKALNWVVIDEVHELADNKRGSQLSLALERLRQITSKKFQMIGLSATIGTPEKVAEFLVGKDRPVEIIRVPIARLMNLQIIFPTPKPEDQTLASSLYTHLEVATRLREIRELIEKHKSVLLFTNTRTIAEVLASRFKLWDTNFSISIHHGSLAKPSRIAAEKGLKEGDLSGLICTSSLELGIDIGRIDLVIQYMSPRQVTRLIQRVGRSGHRIGKMAKGVIVTMDSDDTLEALVIARRTCIEELEPVEVPVKPYDVLTNQIAAYLMKSRRVQFQELHDIFRKAYPFQDINIDDILQVAEYMHNRFPRFAWTIPEEQVIVKPRRSKPLFEYFFENLSMIPDEKQYLVIDQQTDTAIGLLDEAFVAEYGKPGVKFIIRGSPWKIRSITLDKIYVNSVNDPIGSIPSWVGEEIPVPFEVAQEVGWIRGFVEKKVKHGYQPEKIAQELSKRYPAGEHTMLKSIIETVKSAKDRILVPTDTRITFEEWEDFVIIQANLGSLTNRALAQLLGQVISERTGSSVSVQHDPYRIFIKTGGEIKVSTILGIINYLKERSPEFIKNDLTKACIKTGLFKRRMIHVARRFGALKKNVDFSNVSLNSLIKSFEGTIIYEEALKEIFSKDLNLNQLTEVLARISAGKVELAEVQTRDEPTPVAKVGIERASMKTDLIPPEKMKLIILGSTKVRLLDEIRTFICTNCWDYSEAIAMKELPEHPVCQKCNSKKLGILRVNEEDAYPLIYKNDKNLTKQEKKLKKQAISTARMISNYGKSAAIALSGRNLKLEDVKKILSTHLESTLSDEFFSLIIEAERNALKRRFL